MKEYDKRKSHISSKIHVIYVSFNIVRHPVAKTFTSLHYPSLHLSTLHFLPFKLHPTTLHYPLIWLNPTISLPLHFNIYWACIPCTLRHCRCPESTCIHRVPPCSFHLQKVTRHLSPHTQIIKFLIYAYFINFIFYRTWCWRCYEPHGAEAFRRS
jgi:hypothetical protein